jgi:hypothetical protein
MKNLKNLPLLILLMASMCFTSCLHIIEEVTFKKNGSGSYNMTIDMSEFKGMMDMLKTMNTGDSTATEGDVTWENVGEIDTNVQYVPPVAVEETDAPPPPPEEVPVEDASTGNQMAEMGEQLAGGIISALRGVPGISNVVETQDTTNFKFGYSFDFANVDALNKALKIIGKEKYDTNAAKTFAYSGKKFERLAVGNIGEEMKNALSEGGDEAEEGGAEMLKAILGDMSYTQIYHFPDRVVKKTSNSLSELSDGGHTLTIKQKVFDEEQAKAGIATKVKLK